MRAIDEEDAKRDGERDEDDGERELGEVERAQAGGNVRPLEHVELEHGEDGGEGDAEDEDEEEEAVKPHMPFRVKDGEEEEANTAEEGEEDGEDGHHLLAGTRVGEEPPIMPRPSLQNQAQGKSHRSDGASHDEERLEDVGGDVRNVGDCLAGRHGDVVRASLSEPFDEESEDGGEPGEGRGEWYPDVEPVRVRVRAG